MYFFNIKILNFVNCSFMLNKFFFNNVHIIPYFDKIILNSCITKLFNLGLECYPKSLISLELISTQKSFLKNLKRSIKGKKLYNFFFNSCVVVRKKLLYNLLYFFLIYVTPNLKKKLIILKKKLNKLNFFFFKIQDLILLPGFLEFFFKWPFSINFYLFFKNLKFKIFMKKFLQEYGLI